MGKTVTVWYDDTSIDTGYVVDVEDSEGSTMTVNVLDETQEALDFGKRYAEKSGFEFDDRT